MISAALTATRIAYLSLSAFLWIKSEAVRVSKGFYRQDSVEKVISIGSTESTVDSSGEFRDNTELRDFIKQIQCFVFVSPAAIQIISN